MQINPKYQSVLQKEKKSIIRKEILGPKEIRRGQLKTALNKMLPNWMPLKQQLISLFSALLACPADVLNDIAQVKA